MSKAYKRIKKGVTEAIKDTDEGTPTICRQNSCVSLNTLSQTDRIDHSMEV
jgi:hypothetical protein